VLASMGVANSAARRRRPSSAAATRADRSKATLGSARTPQRRSAPRSHTAAHRYKLARQLSQSNDTVRGGVELQKTPRRAREADAFVWP